MTEQPHSLPELRVDEKVLANAWRIRNSSWELGIQVENLLVAAKIIDDSMRLFRNADDRKRRGVDRNG